MRQKIFASRILRCSLVKIFAHHLSLELLSIMHYMVSTDVPPFIHTYDFANPPLLVRARGMDSGTFEDSQADTFHSRSWNARPHETSSASTSGFRGLVSKSGFVANQTPPKDRLQSVAGGLGGSPLFFLRSCFLFLLYLPSFSACPFFLSSL